ncbi:hypothetical protein BH24DEI2_BH24DEI2_15010 [soil metagenome]
MTRRTPGRLQLVATGFGALLAVALAWLWFVPSGSGEFQVSPDARFTAHASNLSRGTLTGGRNQYVQVWVTENGSGREVWRVVRRPPAGTEVPVFENRDERFITWAADSSSVAVPLDGGHRLALEVP